MCPRYPVGVIRLVLCVSLVLAMPGPSAWGQTAALTRGTAGRGVTALPFLASPVSSGAAMPRSSSMDPSLTAILAPAPLVVPVAAAALAHPAAAPVAAVAAAPVIRGIPVALAASPLRPAASDPGSLAAPAPARTPEPASSPAAADPSVFFDGARAFLSIPGQSPREVALSDIEGILASDDAARAALSRKGRVRIVLAKGSPAPDAAAARAALARIGIDLPIEVESILLERPAAKLVPPVETPASRAPASRRGLGTALRAIGWASVAGLAVLQSPAAFAAALGLAGLLLAKDAAFVWREFRASLSRPSEEEVGLTLLARSWPVYFSATAYVALFLPGHPVQFAAIMALTLALKAFHGFWVDTWATFQDRLARKRSYTYATMFNLVYGQVTGIFFRLIAWSAIPNTVAPWMLTYWLDMGIMTLVGTFFGTLGSQAINDLYNGGVISRRARSWLLVGRSTAFDLPGLFFRVGLMKLFWITFAIQQCLDVSVYLAAQFFRGRAILYVVPAAVAASPEFRGRYAMTPEAPLSPLRRAMRALVDNPVAYPFAAAWRWLAVRRAAKAAALAGAVGLYAGAVASPSFSDPAVLGALPVAELELEDGKPVPVSPRGITKPVFSRSASGERGVFKPVRMPATDPLYTYERIKLVRDVVSARIMAGLGVPTVSYRLARANLDGREVLGIESPFVPMRSLKHAPERADEIVNSDDFVRGSVVDAWLGNVDRIQNRGNLWVVESPEGPRVIFGDYDQGLRSGLEIFGVPKVPSGVFVRHAAKSPEALRRAVADILALSDADIAAFVDSAIADMSGFGAEAAPYLKAVLIENRESLRRRDPFTGLASGLDPPLRLDAAVAGALAEGVLQGRRPADAEVPALVDAVLKELISLWDKPALVSPTKALLERVVRARLAGRDEAVETVDGGPEMFKVLTNFAYMRLEPGAAMAAGLGYHR